jgi:hypothetical protein
MNDPNVVKDAAFFATFNAQMKQVNDELNTNLKTAVWS